MTLKDNRMVYLLLCIVYTGFINGSLLPELEMVSNKPTEFIYLNAKNYYKNGGEEFYTHDKIHFYNKVDPENIKSFNIDGLLIRYFNKAKQNTLSVFADLYTFDEHLPENVKSVACHYKKLFKSLGKIGFDKRKLIYNFELLVYTITQSNHEEEKQNAHKDFLLYIDQRLSKNEASLATCKQAALVSTFLSIALCAGLETCLVAIDQKYSKDPEPISRLFMPFMILIPVIIAANGTWVFQLYLYNNCIKERKALEKYLEPMAEPTITIDNLPINE